MGGGGSPDSIGVWGPRPKITSHGVVSTTEWRSKRIRQVRDGETEVQFPHQIPPTWLFPNSASALTSLQRLTFSKSLEWTTLLCLYAFAHVIPSAWLPEAHTTQRQSTHTNKASPVHPGGSGGAPRRNLRAPSRPFPAPVQAKGTVSTLHNSRRPVQAVGAAFSK